MKNFLDAVRGNPKLAAGALALLAVQGLLQARIDPLRRQPAVEPPSMIKSTGGLPFEYSLAAISGFRQVIAGLLSTPHTTAVRTVAGTDDRYLLLSAARLMAKGDEDAWSPSTEDESASFTGVTVSLRDHLQGVAAFARRFTEQARLPSEIAQTRHTQSDRIIELWQRHAGDRPALIAALAHPGLG